jgi:hypothetical protein
MIHPKWNDGWARTQFLNFKNANKQHTTRTNKLKYSPATNMITSNSMTTPPPVKRKQPTPSKTSASNSTIVPPYLSLRTLRTTQLSNG